jgi:hypothetical protein
MTDFSVYREFRDAMIEQLERQLFGPKRDAEETQSREQLSVAPLQLYATGVLFPQKSLQNAIEDDDGGVEAATDVDVGDLETIELEDRGDRRDRGGGEAGDGEREPLNLANEFSPSALGISFRIAAPADIRVVISYGVYHGVKIRREHPRAGEIGADGKPFPDYIDGQGYQRTPYVFEHVIRVGEHPGVLPPIPVAGEGHALKLHVTNRRRTDGSIVVSLMAVNHHQTDGAQHPRNEDAFFQVELTATDIRAKPIFLQIDREFAEAPDDPEIESMNLLYRHRRAFALGHGVAGDWNRQEALSESGCTDRVSSAAVPTYELKPIRPREEPYAPSSGLALSMSYLYDADGASTPNVSIASSLRALAADYDAWIVDQEAQIGALPEPMKAPAARNLSNCRHCLDRMRAGVELLETDADAMKAFRLMNRAMLIQQVHTKTFPRRALGSPMPAVPPDYADDDVRRRKWRPFQLAFILMNVAGALDADHPDRRLVDLIWFPTGGGKTEAYLGLAAFTICLERLRNPRERHGVTVLMRYTLRLLTAQQFQRAAALTLALDLLRAEKALGADLGTQEISIGLWVGQSLSPNRREQARQALAQLNNEAYARNPFQVLQCPWCGVEFTNRDKLGYRAWTSPAGEKTVRFVCPDPTCRFSAEPGLPVYVIDDDIYDAPPTILIGTVDKFAQISWDDQVGRLFGLGADCAPPALVIQDELHLISGPLGSIVGLYEAAIDRLCSHNGRPHKIVASTATIRRAQRQCLDLYARDAFEFPPQALRAGESYFAQEDTAAPGRTYVGFLGSAVKSHQTALVRACAPLLQTPCIDTEIEGQRLSDPYGTVVWYFNSLRELGHAATLCVGDIPEFLKGLCHRLNIPYERRRKIREVVELTSRCSADEIPSILQQLEIPWRLDAEGRPPVDVLLATNMIAVGVDVARLGLIVMSGQPKSTSEYIQASSRVGRQFPGLVVTVYAQTKSRDRSHYERFTAYHQSLYRYVEPTSVTPFSPQARERGMRGVLIALARQLAGVTSPDQIGARISAVSSEVDLLLNRVRLIDGAERDEALQEIEGWLTRWRNYAPGDYGWMAGNVTHETLAFPYGGEPDPEFQRLAWPLLTSMRNVDGTAVGRVVGTYEANNEEAGAQL